MQRQNWHPADIVAALKKQGTSLAALSRKAGLSSSTLANTLAPVAKGRIDYRSGVEHSTGCDMAGKIFW